MQRLFALFRFYRDKDKRLAVQAHKIKNAPIWRVSRSPPRRGTGIFVGAFFLVVTQFEMQAFSLEGAVQQKTEIRGGIFFAVCPSRELFWYGILF